MTRWLQRTRAVTDRFSLHASLGIVLSFILVGCGSNEDTDHFHNPPASTGGTAGLGGAGGSTTAGAGGSTTEGTGGSTTAGVGGSDAGAGGSTVAGTGGSTAAGAGGSSGPDSDGGCAWSIGKRPKAELPPEHTNAYTIDLDFWKIDNNAGNPKETRQRLNEAISWAVEKGFDKIIIPPGHYVVGELTNGKYAAGIELLSDMTLELSKGTVLQMMPNDRENYCVISTEGHNNITIRGGEIVGDRADHDYSSGAAHDEGHGICVWTSSQHILIENTELHELTGDGVLILGKRGKDGEPDIPSTHVTIRKNEIHHNRRQGVSIVGGYNIEISNNHIHHIHGTDPQFGIDIEGAGRRDQDILIYQNNFHDNWGGDFVSSSGHNVWLEENTMAQCQVNQEGKYDPSLPCESRPGHGGQTDGPIVLWQMSDTVVLNNQVRMTNGSSNGSWGIINYSKVLKPYRENPIGNLISGNTFYNCGIHGAWNRLQVFEGNIVNDGKILLYDLECTRLRSNLINGSGHRYRLRNVAGKADGNRQNSTENFPSEGIEPVEFPMADDSPYRNSSPVYW